MDVSQIRMQNYLALRQRFREKEDREGVPEFGELARFAAFTGVAAQYLSHLNNGRKKMGAASARKIEVAFGMAYGWMDEQHPLGVAATPGAAEMGKLAMRLFEQDPDGVRTLLMNYMEQQLKKSKGSENGNGKH